ncbi:hypothetical protein CR513_13764, partial [Mucuna pruriens]
MGEVEIITLVELVIPEDPPEEVPDSPSLLDGRSRLDKADFARSTPWPTSKQSQLPFGTRSISALEGRLYQKQDSSTHYYLPYIFVCRLHKPSRPSVDQDF